MKIKHYITTFFRFLIEANVIKTIVFNFRHMPFKVAIKLPIHLYGPIDLCNTVVGGVFFTSKLHFGGWKIGQTLGPTFGKTNSNHETTCLCVEGKLILGERGFIRNGCIVCIRKKAVVRIGDDFLMINRSKIIAQNSITIGNKVLISWESQIFDSNCHYIYDSDGNVKRFTSPVFIGDYSWIGNRVTIIRAYIGNYSIVASNSLVNKDFGDEDHCVYGGGTCKNDKERIFLPLLAKTICNK